MTQTSIKTILSILLIGLFSFPHFAQNTANFIVDSGSFDRFDCPVFMDFSPIQYGIESNEIQLVEFIDDTEKIIPSQYDEDFYFVFIGFHGTIQIN